MSRFNLSQVEIDNLSSVSRVAAKRFVYTAGFYDADFSTRPNGGKQIWQYKLWCGTLERCFCKKYKAKNPTYRDVTCCDEWLSFGNFVEWVNKEVDYKGKPEGLQLDKDIIVKGNKIYSPEACSFVPRNVNMLLNDHGAARGDWPIGVSLNKRDGVFFAQLSCDGELKKLGCYPTSQEAFGVYKVAKEAQIKVVALRYKNLMKPAVFESLMNWSIEQND